MVKKLLFLLILFTAFFEKSNFGQEKLQQDSVKQIIQQQTKLRNFESIVVGIIDENGKRVISFGKLDKTGNSSADENTIYEIGSITKVFTSLILQVMADRGDLNINDPISKFLPGSVKTPSLNGKEITLLDLSSQVSGLPRMPTNFAPADFQNPFADYSPTKLYSFLSSYKLTRGIGEKYEYSNVGVGLLGHIMSLKTNTDYEMLVREIICKPLNMESTFITLTPELKSRLATGYNQDGEPVKNWDFSALAGAGAFKSSINDMLVFLEACLGLKQTALSDAMNKIQKSRYNTDTEDQYIAMGWHVWKKFNKEIIWHNGGTFGYRSFIGFDKQNKKGVVILTNSASSPDDIGLHLLENKFEINKK